MASGDAHIYLFEDAQRLDLFPFTLTQPVYDLRMGLLTFRERWEDVLGVKVSGYPVGYLQPPSLISSWNPLIPTIWLNGCLPCHPEIERLCREMPPDTYVINKEERVLWACCKRFPVDELPLRPFTISVWENLGLKRSPAVLDIPLAASLTDLAGRMQDLFLHDFKQLTRKRPSAQISDPHTRVYGKDNLWVGQGVNVKSAVINAEDGPVYLGPSSAIGAFAYIEGNTGMLPQSYVCPGARIRPYTIVGKKSVAGGEIKQSILMDWANKGHEGYLGNSIIGRGCNLGAGTTTSNLKNTLSTVKLWNYREEGFVDSGVLKCGLMMGDYSKSGIGTRFNTGSVVGVSSNVWGAGFLPRFIPSFSWGSPEGMEVYESEKAIQTAQKTLALKQISMTEQDKQVLRAVAQKTKKYQFIYSQ